MGGKKSSPKSKKPSAKAIGPKSKKVREGVKQKMLKPESLADAPGAGMALKGATVDIQPSRRKKVKQTRVFLSGNLTVDNCEAFKQAIDPLFNNYEVVDFYLKEVDTLDVTCIQLLYYYQHKYHEEKKVTVDSELSGDLFSIIQTVGFDNFLKKPKLT